MGAVSRIRRWVGWSCLGVVAALLSMGYHFENIRFLPVAAGFAILAGLCLTMGERREVPRNAVHSGADPGVPGAGRR
jgi:hypothetical protein